MKEVNVKEEIAQKKKEIRRAALMRRDCLSAEKRAEYDAEIKERVHNLTCYGEADIILAYAGYRSEAGTAALIKQALFMGKTVFAPKVSGDEMEFWQITSPEDLRKGYRGIPEPVGSITLPDWIARDAKSIFARNRESGSDGAALYRAMMWMPGAVFDRQRHRIGYGGGFYDRYLVRLSDLQQKLEESNIKLCLTTAALAYDCQMEERIPFEPHDIRPDMVITEKGTTGIC